MRLNFKTIIVGGIVFYATAFVFGMISGALIHEGVLDPLYRATESFWRPELRQDPPDLATLMPRWISVGLFTTFVFVAAVSGLKFGLLLGLIHAMFAAGWSGVFNLPDMFWFWWALEGLVLNGLAGMALGWSVGRFGSDQQR